MNFCQECGTMILHGTKCPSCGFDINDFNFKNLKIGIPNEYIYDKDLNYEDLLGLILNKNQFDFEENDILKHSDEIRDAANENFINNEKKIILKDFKNELNSSNMYIDDEKRLCFKSKFNKDYFAYYDNLNFDEQINTHNIDFINNKKNEILKDLPDKYISYCEMCEFQKENNFPFEINSIVEEHNNDYINNQMMLNKAFFENINGKSLDKNQIIAVLTDDDNTQIVAGAGTGKTLTLQAKVKYLIEKQGVAPEDILCISFSNSARDDLARKLKQTIGDAPVEVRTFHSLGYSILGVNGKGKEVPKHTVSDLIDRYLTSSIVKNQNLIKNVVEFFAYYFNIIFINESDLKLETLKSRLNALDEYDEYLSEYLQIPNFKRNREYMATVKELIVANYLFINNIDYEYSKQLVLKDKNYDNFVFIFSKYLFGSYSKKIPEDIKLECINEINEDFACEKFDEYPNFFLPVEDAYIDLNSANYDWKSNLSDDARQIIADKLEKRKKLNKNHKTKILTIFNNDNVEEFIEDIHETLLKNEITLDKLDYNFLFEKLISQNNLEYNRFKKTVERFINLFKGNAINVDYLGRNISKEMFDSFLIENRDIYSSSPSFEKRNKFFLKVIEEIYQCYSKYLEGKYIDFDDMINNAVIALRKGAYIYEYKYVIVDEYQDTSRTRYNLLKEIKNATGAKIIVVGDDWQSIYGFTGCDVSLFSKFEKYFNHPKMIKIEITHRNCQKLIKVVGDFIQKNNNQIEKKLKSDYVTNYLPIKLFEYNTRAEEVLALINILDIISKEKIDANVLILGRNNKDIYDISCREIFSMTGFNDYTNVRYEKNPKLNIEYRTVHKSKGLEADYVVVLNLNNQINGFPNKIVNDPVLDFVSKLEDEGIEYPEERRLFYVALTRTRNDVYLFAKATRPSMFVGEIKDKEGVEKLNYTFSNEDIMKINTLLEKRFDVIDTKNVVQNVKKVK